MNDGFIKGHSREECQAVITAMYLFLDREELTCEQRDHVQHHLDECNPCLEAFEFEFELREVIRQRCKDTLPPELMERIKARLLSEL